MKRKSLLVVLAVVAGFMFLLFASGCNETMAPSVGQVTRQGQSGTTLTASKTAQGFWKRTITYDWSIVKKVYDAQGNELGFGTNIPLAIGESVTLTYKVTATRTPVSAMDVYGVQGTITVTNGGGKTTENLTIVDQVEYKTGSGQFQPLSGASQTIIPAQQLSPGETKTYDYEITFTPISNAIYRNVAKVTITNHSGHLGEEFGPEPKADFSLPGTPTVIEIDESATLSDPLPSVPAGFSISGGLASPYTFSDSDTITYTVTITNESACNASFTLTNTATLTEDDSKEEHTDSTSVTISAPECALPPSGCTYTQGYWKTHSKYGPAPYDDTWARIGEDTLFFLSGQTYYQVLKTSPSGGNAYYILAHQYIAAKLNILNGASSTEEVDAALTWAEKFFSAYTPTSKLSKSVRNEALYYAGILDRYNNGYIGPGHCSTE